MFKIITAAAGLEEKVVDPDEVIDCGHGFLEVAGIRINDHNVFDQLTFREVMAKSSDVGVARVAQRLGRDNFSRYIRHFGFGAPTGVELPGESGGLLRAPNRWSALSLPTLSFGQEIGVTALQMTAAVAAVANGGYLMGDVGSLALGGALGTVAILTKQEVLFFSIGAMFVIEAFSVILQVLSFKLRGKRVFRMAPLHHHFELIGWKETQVVVRFWIAAFIFALLSLTTVKLR